jgi:putative transposase
MRNRKWLRLLAYVTGSVNQELLLQSEYLAAENRILRTKLPARLGLSDPERITVAEIGKRVGRKALREIACVAKPDTILAWYRNLIAQKFDGPKNRAYPGWPRIDKRSRSFDRADGAGKLRLGLRPHRRRPGQPGYTVSDQTVGNVLRRHGIAPAPQRSRTMSWKDFLAAHRNVLAGAYFFTVEVLKWRGLVTYYVLFFIHLETRRVTIAGITRHPDGQRTEQIARSATNGSVCPSWFCWAKARCSAA